MSLDTMAFAANRPAPEHGPSSRAGWSLARRLTALFVISTTVSVVLMSLMGAWFLDRTIQAELDSLAAEELDEMRVNFEASSRTPQDFASISAQLADYHRGHRLAWRVWDESGASWGEFGDPELLVHNLHHGLAPSAGPTGLSSRQRWRTADLGGLRIGFLLDGSEQFRLLERFRLYAGLLVVGSLCAVLLVGWLFSRRVSALLARVAERARLVREADTPMEIEVENPPREIRDIVDALHEMLTNIRRETAETRLFTAGLAHELRSPIQNLIGETEVALIVDRDPGRYRAILHSNLEELSALGDAIDNLVTICSAAETRKTTEREDFDLALEAGIRFERERATAARHGVGLSLSARGDGRIHGDREALMRALRNLVANAIQWSPPGASVAVEIEGRADRIVITVDDAGPGVPPALAERIFEPFFRGPAAKGQRIGYGMGLALARAAALDQGGSLDVASSPAGGARFRMVLLRAPSLPAAPPDRALRRKAVFEQPR